MQMALDIKSGPIFILWVLIQMKKYTPSAILILRSAQL